MAISLGAFIFTYAFVFGAGIYYILRLIAKGPASEDGTYGAHGVENPPLFTNLVSKKGGRNV